MSVERARVPLAKTCQLRSRRFRLFERPHDSTIPGRRGPMTPQVTDSVGIPFGRFENSKTESSRSDSVNWRSYSEILDQTGALADETIGPTASGIERGAGNGHDLAPLI